MKTIYIQNKILMHFTFLQNFLMSDIRENWWILLSASSFILKQYQMYSYFWKILWKAEVIDVLLQETASQDMEVLKPGWLFTLLVNYEKVRKKIK